MSSRFVLNFYYLSASFILKMLHNFHEFSVSSYNKKAQQPTLETLGKLKLKIRKGTLVVHLRVIINECINILFTSSTRCDL